MATVRSLELRLLRCTLPPSDHPPAPSTPSAPSIPPHPLHPLLESLIESIEAGNYIDALSCDAARAFFSIRSQSLDISADSAESAQLFYAESLPEFVNSFVVNDSDGGDVDRCYRGLVVMAIAVAALLAFTQVNITGPFQKLPPMPLTTLTSGKEDEGGDSGGWIEWEGWATRELMSAGSDLCGKFLNLQYIVFAKILLMKVKDILSEGNISSREHELKSVSWWLARILLLQQRLLDDRSSSLFDLLQVYTHECVDQFGTIEKLTKYWSSELSEEDASTITSLLHLEAGIMELTYGRTDSSRQHFELATLSSRLDFSISGALGFRTLHQVEPKAQLRLVASTNSSDAAALLSPEFQNDNSTTSEGAFHQHPPETREASDVLMAPRFVEDDKKTETSAQGVQSNGIASIQLKAVHQAVVLAQCFSIERSARSDELEMWKMAPYIEAIDAQQSSHFIIKYLSDILRIRWESTRSRTKQRALLIMDKLVEGIYEAVPGITQRMYCCFAVNVPTIPAVRKEYGDLLVSCRLIGEAVKVYEDLELWDNLIYCYRLLEKKAAAVELIKKRLSESPCDPRLCFVSDIPRVSSNSGDA